MRVPLGAFTLSRSYLQICSGSIPINGNGRATKVAIYFLYERKRVKVIGQLVVAFSILADIHLDRQRVQPKFCTFFRYVSRKLAIVPDPISVNIVHECEGLNVNVKIYCKVRLW